MLVSLGWQIPYEKETRTRKTTLKTDALGHWRMTTVQRISLISKLMDNNGSLRDGALPVESRRAGGVPGPVPQRGPPQAAGGHHVPMRGARFLEAEGKSCWPEKNHHPHKKPFDP